MLYRKARIHDVETIHALITYYAGKGLMLARSRAMMYEFLRDFTVAEDQGNVVAAGALHILWEDLAEVRALAVAPEYAKQGIGRGLVGAFIREAWDIGIPRVFSLTYQAGFFQKCGFSLVSKDVLPHKVWKECIDCPKFPNCDENAVLMEIK
ncbi:MAG: GNAT family N-acetyltransferase [Firmicutes bacterium HGW-Firmicutes-14]|nr:MAG: GNAT family N-acetyltransferase [Firmicutes bacterium HGW-Firmicutes-14]